MRKLILIPTVLLTGLLALSFAMPATSSAVARAAGLSVHLNLSSAFSGTNMGTPAVAGTMSTSQTGSKPGKPASIGVASNIQTATGPTTPADPSGPAVQDTHDVATTGHSNCGRYGNGFHGGKHLLVCPNRPFPGAVHTHT